MLGGMSKSMWELELVLPRLYHPPTSQWQPKYIKLGLKHRN